MGVGGSPDDAVVGSELDQALAEALRTGPFHVAFRTAVRLRRLALHRLRHRLAERGLNVSVTSLSYWQRGERVPSRPESVRVVRVLEQILDLPPGALVRLLEPRTAGGRAGPRAARGYQDLVGASTAVRRLLDALDCPTEDRLHTVSQVDRIHLGGARDLWRRDTQQLVRGHQGEADRYVTVYEGDIGCDVSNVRIDPLDNCRLGRVRSNPEASLLAVELVFDRALRAGDSHPFRYQFTDPTGAECSEFVRGFRYPVGHYLLQAYFAPSALPVRCYRFTRNDARAPRRGLTPVPLNGYHSAHVAEQQVRPGVVGMAWEWE